MKTEHKKLRALIFLLLFDSNILNLMVTTAKFPDFFSSTFFYKKTSHSQLQATYGKCCIITPVDFKANMLTW